VFRLGLLCALVALLRGLRRGAVPVGLVVSAVLFALAHHAGPHGEALTAHALVYRVLAGCAFGAIFWYRSLAHAVYAHVLYDLLVAAAG
jgi:membrane protease YdiL (CAAX protease family)